MIDTQKMKKVENSLSNIYGTIIILRAHANDLINFIKEEHPFIYYRRKGTKVPYTYTKYSTKYLTLDNDYISPIKLVFENGKSLGFNHDTYRKLWGFSKEDFEDFEEEK